MKFTRITVNPEQMGGVPCIRGLRIPIATVVGMVAEGMTVTRSSHRNPRRHCRGVALPDAVQERALPKPLSVIPAKAGIHRDRGFMRGLPMTK